MSIEQYISKKKELYDIILYFLENDEDHADAFSIFQLFFTKEKIGEKYEELNELIHLLMKIADNHTRKNNLIDKIEQIILFIKNDINLTFTNIEIFKLFRSNNVIIHFLITNKIIVLDRKLTDVIFQSDSENHSSCICQFFPEITADPSYIDKYTENIAIGENDAYICKLIRDDSVVEFIKYTNMANIPLNSQIQKSLFETNAFLIDNEPTLIEYAAFFGSIQVFNYLKNNEIDLNKSLYLYAIHGNNPELIHILERSI